MTKNVVYPSVMAETEDELSTLFQKFDGIADRVHLDIADGIAVPARSLYFPFSIQSRYSFRAHAHLMVKNPEQWITTLEHLVEFCIPHLEYLSDVPHFISSTKQAGIPTALAIRPETPVATLLPFLHSLDYVLILTVNPGFYGSPFLPGPLEKIETIKQINRGTTIIVDGGMTPETIPLAIRAGADHIVSGSFLAKAANPRQAMVLLQEAIMSAKNTRVPQ